MSGRGPGPVLLTGASGFVGAAVMRALVAAGYPVRALVRRPPLFRPAGRVETRQGDVTDFASVLAAARGCRWAIHCAADYRLALGPGDASRMIAVNVGGTANLLRACAEAGVRRLVHCSTVGTLDFQRTGRVCTELDVATSSVHLPGPYKRTKWAAERLVLEAHCPGLEVVVVQPSTPVGGGDQRPTPTGATIRDFLGGRIPAVVDTGLNWVDVEAVGRGHLLALERGLAGRSYILGDRNLSLAQMLGRIAQIAGVEPPRWRVPLALAFAVAGASEAAGRLRREPAGISMTSVRMAAHPMYVDARRARDELGWDPGDLELALRRAVSELGPMAWGWVA
ncbi:MAG: NAD-dependent epimerase/dehydratase family protein [Candidatus Dormibacteria bacterium]